MEIGNPVTEREHHATWTFQGGACPAQPRLLTGLRYGALGFLPKVEQHSDGAPATRAGRTGKHGICTVEQQRVRQQGCTIQVHG